MNDKLRFESGVYEYKGKQYYAHAWLKRGAGDLRGMLFVEYAALYPCPDGKDFIREVSDFRAKFIFKRKEI